MSEDTIPAGERLQRIDQLPAHVRGELWVSPPLSRYLIWAYAAHRTWVDHLFKGIL